MLQKRTERSFNDIIKIMATTTRRQALRMLLVGALGVAVAPTLDILTAQEAEARDRSKAQEEAVPVQFRYKTILGNDPRMDEFHRLQTMAGQYRDLARFIGGEANLSIPEGAAIQFTKDAGLEGMVHRSTAPYKKYDEVISKTRRGNTITQITGFDLSKYIQRDNDELNALAQAITKGYQTQEEKAQALLCFVQTAVKYDHAKAEEIKRGNTKKDFVRNPIQTLADQTGDCKDTSVLYASLLLSISVQLPAFVFYPQHVNVGVPLDFRTNRVYGMPEDMFLDGKTEHAGRTYYIAETTPERAMYLGRVMVAQQGEPITRVKVIK